MRWLNTVGLASIVVMSMLVAAPGRAQVPSETQNVSWCTASKDCLQWTSTPGAAQYRVYRGEQSSLGCLVSAPLDSCLEAIFAAPSTGLGAIPEIPASGRFYWYLVTAQNGTGEGPSGSLQQNAVTQPRVRNTFGSCPVNCTAASGSCLAASDCCSSNCAGACQAACCAPTGAICGQPSDCCSNVCVAALCQPCIALGQSCTSSASCCTGNCSGSVCVAACAPNGDVCGTGGQCCSGNCVAASCQPACTPPGGGCTTSSQCCSGLCSMGLCVSVCGDGVVSGTEQCDDGNNVPFDGCSATCTGETGYTCTGSPSVCVPCPSGYSNCNGSSLDGCEVHVSADPSNCGGCGLVCATQNATAACVGGVCAVGACNPGYADCNLQAIDGCEVYTPSDPNNCGTCGAVCSLPNATATCLNGACALGACNPGYADCNSQAIDGCEVNIASSPNNCGGCGTVCSPNNIPTPTCSSGTCNGACAAGFVDCNGNKQADGCEVNVVSNPNNCGGCGTVCSSNNIPTPTCSSGSCNGTCAVGFGDCNGNKQADGCEINLSNNNSNCGTCGHVCPVATFCVSGGCFAP